MANERRLIVLDYNSVREAFDKEFKGTMQLIKNGETHLDNLAEGFTEADRVLRKMATGDAVEVVRCRDCVFYRDTQDWNGNTYKACHLRADVFIPEREPDDFCSRGERRITQPQKEDV